MKKIILITTASLFSGTILFAQNNNALNLKKGQKYLVENKVSTKSSTKMQGQEMEANADVTSTYSIEVNDLVDNNYNLTNTVTGVKMNMSQMGQEMNFDSEKKEDIDGPIGSALKEYINQPKKVVIDKSGKLIPQQNDDSSEETNMVAKQLGNFEATGYGADMAFESLPQDLKAGSTWTLKTDNDGISKSTTYLVKEINGNMATIELNGDMTTDTKMENQGMEITTKTTGKFSGEETVDISTGVIHSNTSTVDASGIIGVMGQELPTSSKITSTTTVTML
ncbi:MAG: DUF6263 family protein [Bacteroidota bacterium]|nr:DUF6263 family protein [Bacteroidota bacterium]